MNCLICKNVLGGLWLIEKLLVETSLLYISSCAFNY